MTIPIIPAVEGCRTKSSGAVNQVALELTEACNYRCVMCDYWRIPNPKFMPVQTAADFFALFKPGQLNSVLLTGGEPLLHPHWREIAAMIPSGARKLLCTNGSPILKKNGDVAHSFDRITVSIDGATDQCFEKIRGYPHLSGILRSLERMKREAPKLVVFLKMTVQRENVHEMSQVFDLAATAAFVDGVGFGIPDLSAAAFGFTQSGFSSDSYLDRTLPDASGIAQFEAAIDYIESAYADKLKAGFMYEGDLRRYLQRFKFLRRMVTIPPAPRHCSIPKYSLVLKADGRAGGCYFLGDTATISSMKTHGLRIHNDATAAHASLKNPVCRQCDQLMNRPADSDSST